MILALLVAVLLHTEAGDIRVEVDAVHAPDTAANFLRYVREGFYNGGVFHRSVKLDNQPNDRVKIQVIQAGANPADRRPQFAPLRLERTNRTNLRHLDGTISMARDGPDTATSDFFICVGDQPDLDFGGKRNPDGQGFAAFGRVVSGMDVVRRIHRSRVRGQEIVPAVRIRAAEVVK